MSFHRFLLVLIALIALPVLAADPLDNPLSEAAEKQRYEERLEELKRIRAEAPKTKEEAIKRRQAIIDERNAIRVERNENRVNTAYLEHVKEEIDKKKKTGEYDAEENPTKLKDKDRYLIQVMFFLLIGLTIGLIMYKRHKNTNKS